MTERISVWCLVAISQGIGELPAKGKDEHLNFEIVGARNVGQVKRVLAGKTYRRVS